MIKDVFKYLRGLLFLGHSVLAETKLTIQRLTVLQSSIVLYHTIQLGYQYIVLNF